MIVLMRSTIEYLQKSSKGNKLLNGFIVKEERETYYKVEYK